MAISLTGAGSLFVKQGHIAAASFDLMALCGGAAYYNSAAVVNTGGSYAANDTITLTGGTAVQQMVIKVLTVSGGAILTFSVLTEGIYTTAPSNPVSQGSTSGSGTSATFAILPRVGTPASQVARTATLEADYAAGTPQYQIIDGFASAYANAAGSGALQSSVQGNLTTLQTLASSTLVDMANTDTPLASKTLTAAMTLLIQQMVSAGQTVQASVVSAGAQTAVAVPVGNPVVVSSSKNRFAKTCEYALPETVTFTCTGDSVSGSATVKQEQFSITGQNAVANQLSYQWAATPFGSGAALTMTLTDANQNNSGGNLLQNSEFVTATTASNPDNWTLVSPATTTNVLQASSGYVDSFSLQFLSDGSNFWAITQLFNTTPVTTVGAGGTAGVLAPDTQYALNCWVKCSATPTNGTLAFDLIDGSNNVMQDDSVVTVAAGGSSYAVGDSITLTGGTASAQTILKVTSVSAGAVTAVIINTQGSYTVAPTNPVSQGSNTGSGTSATFNINGFQTFTKVLTAVSTSWVNVNGVFRTPANLPTTQKLRIRLAGTILDNTKSVFVDRVGLSIMTPLYTGGPSFAMFSALTNPVASGTQPDQWTVAITNTFGIFQKYFQQFFSMTTIGLQLPSTTGTPTIADTLVA